MTKISVIVPVYNGEKTLAECLDSILKQKHTEFELIIVNNHSTDSTLKIIEKYEEKDSRVRTVFEEKLSLGAARNKGINSAKYNILAMTDCDCIVPTDWLEKLLEILEKENENVVIGFQYDLTKNFWSKLVQDADEDYMYSVRKEKYINSFDPKNFIAKTEVMKKIMFDSNQTYMEDVDFYVRSKGLIKIRFAGDIKVGHYNKSSLSKVIKVNFSRAFWLVPVYKKNKEKSQMDSMTMFTGMQKSKVLLSPLLAIRLFFTNSPSLAFYKIIAGASWLAGLGYGNYKWKK